MNKLILLFFALCLFSCGNKKDQGAATEKSNTSSNGVKAIMADQDMIAYLEKNKEDFDNLANWMIEDKISHIPLFSSEIHTGKTLKVSEERLAAYNALIEKHSIVRIVFGNATKFNSVVFYMAEVKDGDETINKGYEYKKKPEMSYNGWVETTEDLMETAKKHPLGTFVVKPIKDNWNLLILIQ